ncbi:hypothetical protein KC959_00045 [Candidatus Saccharibacteria bacterium]|nr:hypothetical protein [Candidatus Saccharibacteria bacterium]
MFGKDDNNQAVMGSPTVQNPSMLDNVSSSDFQTADSSTPDPSATSLDPAQTSPMQDMMQAAMPVLPPAASTDEPTAQDDQPQTVTPSAEEHPMTTDNPFVSDNASADAAQPAPADDPATSQATDEPPATDQRAVDSSTHAETPLTEASPSAPVEPPVMETPEDTAGSEQSDYMSAITSGGGADAPVDHDKLASMKQEALEHLEPLADHIGGTPEETFKTTMMMIQANDNHTLLEKALAAAKMIEDDKTRAQAMLDIINEINYFSQNNNS